jgi:Ser/Thr protein kinase RdoA (MazF antagonist)
MQLERVAAGRTAEVFAWDDGRVLKLIRPEMPEGLGETEARAARAACDAGLAAPRLIETIRVDGRFGLVYERLDGPSMLDALAARPLGIGRLAGQFARLHAAMHDASGAGLENVKEYLGRQTGRAGDVLPAELREAARRHLDRLPDGDSILHGDMHPGNVVMTAAGPKVIDWMTVTRGAAAADVARTIYLVGESPVPDDTPVARRAAIGLVRKTFLRAYLREYRRLRPIDDGAIRAWRPVVLAARLGEHIESERDRLLAELRRTLPG